MKKKIIFINLIIIVTICVLFILTGCQKKDKSYVEPSIKLLLKDATDAVNEKDAKKLISCFDLDSLEKTFEEEINEEDLEKGLNDFFEQNKDLNIKLSIVQKLIDDEEALKDLYEYYDSYDEYVKEIKDDYDFKNLVIYTAKLDVPEGYKELYEDSSTENGKDVFYIIKVDGNYKIIYSNFIVSLYYDYFGEDEYSFDEYYDEDFDEEYNEETEDFEDDFEIDDDNSDEIEHIEDSDTNEE